MMKRRKWGEEEGEWEGEGEGGIKGVRAVVTGAADRTPVERLLHLPRAWWLLRVILTDPIAAMTWSSLLSISNCKWRGRSDALHII